MPKDSDKSVLSKIEARQQALEFAKGLEFLASQAPGPWAKAETQKLIKQIQKRYGFTDPMKKTAILGIVREGSGVTIGEIVKLTGWHRDKVRDLCAELEDAQLIYSQTADPTEQGGRPPVLFRHKSR